jgi:epidermal growth factor receptor substrate 15
MLDMKRFLLLFLLISSSFSVVCQVQVDIDVMAKDLKLGKKEAGVTVRVYEGSKVVASGVTAASGKVLLNVPSEKTYKVEISKAGKVTRFATLNTGKIDVELLQGASNPLMYFEVSMFDETPNVDYSYIKNTAITEFYFDGKNPKLAYNVNASSKMEKEVDKAIAAAQNASGNVEAQFQAKMQEAEALATQKKYVEAAKKFEQALFFKPTDKVANKRLADMDALVKADKVTQLDGQALNSEFDNLVKAAEILKGQKKWQEAIDKYEEALEKKDDQAVSDEIDDLMAIIKKEKKEKDNETAYTNAMAAAEGLLKQKSYQAALDQYVIALKAKPADPIATKKKGEVELLINASKGEAEKKKNYELAVAAGDELFKAEKWNDAKAKYDEALTFQPVSTYVSGQLNAIKTKLDEIEKEKQKVQQIAGLIAEGTTAMNANQWDLAKSKFEAVQKVDAQNPTAIEKLKIINAKIEENKLNAANEATFKKFVEEGDALVKTVKYTEAVAKYEEAIKLKADASLDKKIADAKLEIEKIKNQKETKEKYDLAMKDGEAALLANKLEDAKVKFTEAKNLDDKAQLPKDKLKIVEDKILAEENKKMASQKYTEAMASGEKLYGEGKLVEARAEFFKAKDFDKTQTAPDTKIKLIDDQLKIDAANKEKTEKYTAAMKAGDEFRVTGKLTEAIAEYKKAKVIDGSKPEPDSKIKEVEAEMLTQADAKAQKEKADKFNAAMKAGDDFRVTGKYTEAIAEYKKAKVIDGSKTEPDTKIKEVEAEIITQADAKAQKEKADKFAATMKAGDEFRGTGKLTEAIAEYNKAKLIDGTQTSPDTKIKEVEAQILSEKEAKSKKEIADKYYAAMKAGSDFKLAGKLTEARAEYVKAKDIDGSQSEPDKKISEIDNELGTQATLAEKKKQIDALIKEGIDLEGKNELENAKSKYSAVLQIDDKNVEAIKKVAELNKKIEAENAQKAKDNQFTTLKSQGLEAFNKSKWEEAKGFYTDAKKIKTDPEIEQKLKDIEVKIAEEIALKSADAQYNDLISEAGKLEASKDYDGAIKKYKEASLKKQNEKLPKDKIEEIEGLKKIAAAQKIIDDNYNDKMKKGGDAFAAEDYPLAIKFFNEANGIKPTEKEPVDKAEQARLKYEAQNIDFKIKYEKMLVAAQSAIDEKNWDKAIDLYNRALVIKKDDPLPKSKLVEIENAKKAEEESKLAQAQIDKNYNIKMSEAEAAVKLKEFDKAINLFTEAKKLKPAETLPDTRISDVNNLKSNILNSAKIEEAYKKAILSGDEAVRLKEYDRAISEYNNALNAKPGDKTAASKIDEVEQIIDNLTNTAKQQKQKEEFNALVKKADNYFKSSDWANAKSTYNEALLLQKDAYVSSQIKKCEANDKAQTEIEAKYKKVIDEADDNFNKGEYIKAKELYTKALTIKKDDEYPKQKLDQIEGILNPKIVQTGALPVLGTPSNNSVLEGEALLAKADAQRKNLVTTKMSEEVKSQQELVTSRTEDRNEVNLSMTTGIQEIEKQRTINAPSDDENRLNMVNDVFEKSKNLEKKATVESNFENGEFVDLQSKVLAEKQTVDQNYIEKEDVYNTNTSTLKISTLALDDKLRKDVNDVYKTNLSSQIVLNGVVIRVSENTFDDLEARKVTELDVRTAQRSVNKIEDERYVVAFEKSNGISNEVIKQNEIKNKNDEEDSKIAAANKEDLKLVENNILDKDFKTFNKNVQSNYETETKLDNERVELSNANVRRDDNRLADVEAIEKGNSELAEKSRNEFNNLFVKSLKNQESLSNEKKVKDGEVIVSTEKQQVDYNVISNVDKKLRLQGDEGTIGDEKQRQDATAKLSTEMVNSTVANAKNVEKPNENKEILNKSDVISNEKDKAEQAKQVEKNYNARKIIDQIESKTVKFDEAAANELGSAYPEGVSQESFNQNGNDGLLVAIVTRRIVVNNGHGSIYVRKQTLTGITYSKNGDPSTEYIWQKETADGKLKKNY